MKKTHPDRTDPFADPALKGPGVWRTLQETFGRKQRLLDVAQIEISSYCSGKCVYCPHTTMHGTWKARHMKEETFVRLWPLLLETRRVHLQGWGEPLLHPRFLDMVRLCRRADCYVSTTTCGLVMREALAESLVDSGLDIIAFSLTGSTEASHNATRKGVDFHTTLEAIRLLQEVRKRKMGVHLEVHFAYLMMADAVDEVTLLPELMQEYGVHAAVVSTLDYLPTPQWADEAFLPHEQEKIERAREVLRRTAARAKDMGLAFHYSLPVPDARPDCLESPARSVFVDAEGALAPCIYLNVPTSEPDPSRRVFGSCMTEDPVSLWTGPRFEAFRQALASCTPEEPCLDCPKRFAVGNRS